MIKATYTKDGRTTLMIGLSFNNLNTLRAEPLDTYIKIDGKAMNLPIDIMIFSGETEAHLASLLQHSIGPDTILHVDPKLKS